MAGSALGAQKAVATRLGISWEDYQARIASGQKWCTKCKAWHDQATFDRDASRVDGLTAACRVGRRQLYAETYEPRPRPEPGRRFVEARDGDRKQARGRVNHLVTVGLLPDPNDRPCVDCGHVHEAGGMRHEYDHHLGYAGEHHEDVEPVCTKCHADRERARGLFSDRDRDEEGRYR